MDTVVVERVREYLAEKGKAAWLDLLPGADTLTFEEQTYTRDAIPVKLLIGTSQTAQAKQLWVYLFQFGDKPREVRYFAETPDGGRLAVRPDGLKHFNLVHPFDKALEEGSPVGQRAVTNACKWYFSVAGHTKDGELGMAADYEYRMYLLVKRMYEVQQGIVSGPRVPAERHSLSAIALTGMDAAGEKHIEEIVTYLRARDSEHYLQEIPSEKDMVFTNQQDFTENHSTWKLFVGTVPPNSTDEIWVYLQRKSKFFMTKFYMLAAGGRRHPIPLTAEKAMASVLIEPFNYLASDTSQDGKARLTALIKYYFLAAGREDVGGDVKNFPYRVYSAIECIMEMKSKNTNAEQPKSDTAGTGGMPAQPERNSFEGSDATLAFDEEHVDSYYELDDPHTTENNSFEEDNNGGDTSADGMTHRQDEPNLDRINRGPQLQANTFTNGHDTARDAMNGLNGDLDAQLQQSIFENGNRLQPQSLKHQPQQLDSDRSKRQRLSGLQNQHLTPVARVAPHRSSPVQNPTPMSAAFIPKITPTPEDVRFRDLHNLHIRDHDLTRRINDLDAQIQEWQMKRNALEIQRKDNREDIRRMSHNLSHDLEVHRRDHDLTGHINDLDMQIQEFQMKLDALRRQRKTTRVEKRQATENL